MEFLAILLSGLLGLVSPAGFVADQLAEKAIRNQLSSVEQFQVRIDNSPTHQVLQGNLDQVRIAGRGVFPIPEVRIAELEVETDPIHLDPQALRQGKPRLEAPVQAGVRLALTEEDLNRALRSPTAVQRLQKFGISFFRDQEAQEIERYDFIEPQIEFLGNNRLRVQVGLLQEGDTQPTVVVAETGLEVLAGQRLNLIEPVMTVDGQAVPDRLVQSISKGIRDRVDLGRLAEGGIVARLLQLEIDADQLQAAVFVRAEPSVLASGK